MRIRTGVRLRVIGGCCSACAALGSWHRPCTLKPRSLPVPPPIAPALLQSQQGQSGKAKETAHEHQRSLKTHKRESGAGPETHVCSRVPFAGHRGSPVLLLLGWTGRRRLECGSDTGVTVLRTWVWVYGGSARCREKPREGTCSSCWGRGPPGWLLLEVIYLQPGGGCSVCRGASRCALRSRCPAHTHTLSCTRVRVHVPVRGVGERLGNYCENQTCF